MRDGSAGTDGLKDRNHVISTEAENTSDKIPNPFVKKGPKKTGVEGTRVDTKVPCENPTANSGNLGKWKEFPLKVHCLPYLIAVLLAILVGAVR